MIKIFRHTIGVYPMILQSELFQLVRLIRGSHLCIIKHVFLSNSIIYMIINKVFGISYLQVDVRILFSIYLTLIT